MPISLGDIYSAFCAVLCSYWRHFVAAGLNIMARRAHGVRWLLAALLLLQNVVHCSSQPSPALPVNRFGTKNAYSNIYYRQHEGLDQNKKPNENDIYKGQQEKSSLNEKPNPNDINHDQQDKPTLNEKPRQNAEETEVHCSPVQVG